MGSVVYFIESEDGLVKIGWTGDLARRLNTLNTASPRPLRVLATTPGGATLEAHLHERFATTRDRGEWFRSSADLRHLIQQILDGRADIFAAGLVEADADEAMRPDYLGSRAHQASLFARRLVDLGVEKDLTVRQSIAQIVSRLHVQEGTITALLYRCPNSVDADLYFRLRSLLADDLSSRLRGLESELFAIRKAREPRFSPEDLDAFDGEISRLRNRISALREDRDD